LFLSIKNFFFTLLYTTFKDGIMETLYYILNIEDPDDTCVLEKGMYVYIVHRSELQHYGRITFVNKQKFHIINAKKLYKYIYSKVRPGTQGIIQNIVENYCSLIRESDARFTIINLRTNTFFFNQGL